MARYHFAAEWQVDAPVERVWDSLLAYRDWPTWWKGFRSVEQLRPGDERGVGMELRQRWRTVLPYTLVLDLEILRIERLTLLVGRVSGDLAGTCTWILEERDGKTTVRMVFDVRPTRRWMNLPVPFAGRVFAYSFDRIMRRGSEGMARLLGAGVIDLTAAVRPAEA